VFHLTVIFFVVFIVCIVLFFEFKIKKSLIWNVFGVGVGVSVSVSVAACSTFVVTCSYLFAAITLICVAASITAAGMSALAALIDVTALILSIILFNNLDNS
jgi:hypothetical protein